MVHCHSSKAGILGRLAARQCGIPSVYTPHAFAFLRKDIGPMTRACFQVVEWGASFLGDVIVACGDEEAVHAQKLVQKHGRVVCIPNAVDFAAYNFMHVQAQQGAPSDKARVGMCGRVHAAQRSPELFSAIATQLADTAHWVWVGAPHTCEILPPFVQRTGWLDKKAAVQALASLDVYLHTSAWDGCSYALLEAMALGKAVVATDIPANRALVQHGVTGFLGSTAEELTQHVRQLCQDTPLRQRMGQAAHAYILQHHDAAKAYKAYADVYRSLCSPDSRAL